MGITKEILEKLIDKASLVADEIELVMGSDEFKAAECYADDLTPMHSPKDHKTAVCRICGCTWDHACPGGCWWVDEDLCSTCAEKISDLVMVIRGAQRALEDQMNLIDRTINPDQYDAGGPYAEDDLECLDKDEAEPNQDERCYMCLNIDQHDIAADLAKCIRILSLDGENSKKTAREILQKRLGL